MPCRNLPDNLLGVKQSGRPVSDPPRSESPLQIVPPTVDLHTRGPAFLLCLALVAVPGLAAPAGDPPLSSALDRAVGARALRGAQTAALVVARDDGRVLYARDPDRALVPASNQKILTAIAALSAFGPTHRFVTEVWTDVPPDPEGAVGWLGIRGGGDPALTSEELWRLAADLRARGVRRVRGGLLLDDRVFDQVRWHPTWGPISARAYHAPVGGLSVNYGAFAAIIEPGDRPGDPVTVRMDPPVSFLDLANRARTGPISGRRSLVVDRKAAGTAQLVTVSGSTPVGAEPKTYHRSVLEPALYAGSVLRMQLEANGIRVQGQTRQAPLPEPAHRVLSFEGPALAETVRLFMKYSNNAIAESLVKAMGVRAAGAPGTWETGMPALRAELASIGLDTTPLDLRDGSGLSYENRVTPRSLVEALRLASESFRFGPEFVTALPIAAADGTLEERAEGAAHVVRAKTGLLTRVTALSGFAQRADGTEVVFSILANGYRGNAEQAMAALDTFVATLVTGPTTAAKAPSP